LKNRPVLVRSQWLTPQLVLQLIDLYAQPKLAWNLLWLLPERRNGDIRATRDQPEKPMQ